MRITKGYLAITGNCSAQNLKKKATAVVFTFSNFLWEMPIQSMEESKTGKEKKTERDQALVLRLIANDTNG